MQKNSFYYNFSGIRFSPFNNQLEVVESGKKLKLSPIHSHFLLALVENPQRVVTFDEFRQSIWLHEPVVDARLIRNIQSTKNQLLNVFKTIGLGADLIKPIPREGYLLDANVTEESESANTENSEAVSMLEIPASNSASVDDYQAQLRRKNRLFGEHAVYAAVSSLLYGLLFWIALLLEVAYQFDRHGATALWLGFPTILWIAGTSFIGLILTERAVRQKNRTAFFIGLAFFVGAATALCLAMSYFLPNTPVTLARIQTQPAFAAYLKNSLIYFLPLGIIFVLMPFYFVCVRRAAILRSDKNDSFFHKVGANNLRSAHLFGLWLTAMVYSIFSTFYLLDNLAVGDYHNLFVVLVFLRFFVYFGLGLSCAIWYYLQLSLDQTDNADKNLSLSFPPPDYAPRRSIAVITKNYGLKSMIFSAAFLVIVVAVAARYYSIPDEEQIKRVIQDSQKYESSMIYKNPASFKEEQLDKYWTAEADVFLNADRNRIREAVRKLNADGRRYGDETKCEQFEFQTIEINEDKNFAVVKTLEKWFIAVYFADGTLQKNKTVGPYFVSYILRKIDRNWLIEKSTTARVNRPTPRLSEIETVSAVKAGQPFFAKITGQDFEPEMIFIEVVGEGCLESKPCKISNTALRENSKLTETVLENVPLTLASGDFRLVAHNGDSPPSNALQIKVP